MFDLSKINPFSMLANRFSNREKTRVGSTRNVHRLRTNRAEETKTGGHVGMRRSYNSDRAKPVATGGKTMTFKRKRRRQQARRYRRCAGGRN